MYLLRILMPIFLFINLNAQEKIQAPNDFISGYGTQYSFEYKLNEYYNYLAQSSPKIKKIKYGESWESRPLHLLFVSSPENILNLESIRSSHLYNLGLTQVKSSDNGGKAFVWLSFGVHGNEAGASESVPEILYRLISNSDRNYDNWLKDVVVIIDPNLNPDGNSRYTHWINQVSGKNIHPDIYDREHFEPWPRGRYNHYLFDLNRDWAWQTQKETKQRIDIYNQWMPHIHADFHEMGHEANYYFAPAAEPFHKYITGFQRDFQTEIGKNHARYFDEKGLLYWTRERFDLFYPSYGDTYPTFNGAIGMTYEQAGHSFSGRAIILSNGDTLTLARKIDNNTTIALSTVEMAAKHTDALTTNLIRYFSQSQSNPKGKFKSYFLKNNDWTKALTELLNKAGIEYFYSAQNMKVNAYHYQSGQNQQAELQEGDIVIQVAQPRSTLLQVLMEENPELADSLTYDITAWALPFAYNVDCYATTLPLNVKLSQTPVTKQSKPKPQNPYAALIRWDDPEAPSLLASVMQKGIRARLAKKEVVLDGYIINRGDLLITRGDNPTHVNLIESMADVNESGNKLHWITTGYSASGGDIGGEAFELMAVPRVLLLSGEGTDATGVGEVWHYFDRVINYPLSIMDVNHFQRVDLSKFNVLVLPGGWYSLEPEKIKEISVWVSKGGKLIALEDAVRLLDGQEGFGLQLFATENEKTEAEKTREEEALKSRTYPYESFERRFLSSGTAGAIIKNEIDESHPLGFGLGKFYYSLKTNAMVYTLQKDFNNVVKVPQAYKSYGFIGYNLKSKLSGSVTLASRNYGRGQVVCFVDNPLFRGFWSRGLQLFSNALFFSH